MDKFNDGDIIVYTGVEGYIDFLSEINRYQRVINVTEYFVETIFLDDETKNSFTNTSKYYEHCYLADTSYDNGIPIMWDESHIN